MPGRYVFPGGVLEPEDLGPSGFAERLRPAPAGLDGASRRRLASFARAALRETFEESGLLIGSPGASAAWPGPGVWQAYGAARLAPAFDALTLLASAVTPSSYPLRFHARFFLADGALAWGPPRSLDELEAVAWVPIRETGALPMPSVTRRVLEKALAQRCLRPRRHRAWRFA